MEHQPFDKAIKETLENLKAEYNAAHWEQMEQLLNNLPVGDATDLDAHFDALIKDKIGNIEIPVGLATNWATIDKRLTEAEIADKQFDTIITDKIGALEVAGVAAWEGIEQVLDAKDAADAAFDAQVFAKFQHLRPNYKPSHWQRLVNKLNANYALREKLYRYKLMEATLMILLLLNFYQYFPTTYTNKVDDTPKQESPFQQVKSTEEKLLKPSIEQETKQNSTKQPQAKKTNKQPLIAAKESIAIDNKSTDHSLINQAATNELIATKLVRSAKVTANIPRLSTSIEQRSALSISVSEMNRHLTLHTETGNSLIATVPSLQPNFVESQYITPLGCKDCKYAKIPARLRLGLIANLALTNAYRTGGQILDISTLNQKGFGYGSGLSLGFKYGRWEIETGLVYAAKQYDPNIVEQHGGIVSGGIRRTHFQTIHLQTLHIPANLRYNYAVLGKGKWHLYAQTGAALNVILRAEYDLAEISAGSRSSSNTITTSRLSQIDYNNGLLAGDGFKANRYLSISMGAGLERYISPSWSIFVQPDFHFHFSGNRIGPTEDRINTLSISFGARKSL